MTKDTQTAQSGEDWKDIALTLVTNAVKQSSAGIIQAVHERVDSAVHAVVTRLVIALLAVLGAALVVVGAAQYLGALLGMAAYGYLIMGGVVLLVAALMHFAHRR